MQLWHKNTKNHDDLITIPIFLAYNGFLLQILQIPAFFYLFFAAFVADKCQFSVSLNCLVCRFSLKTLEFGSDLINNNLPWILFVVRCNLCNIYSFYFWYSLYLLFWKLLIFFVTLPVGALQQFATLIKVRQLRVPPQLKPAVILTVLY